jgi:hypothetical protein
MFVALIDLMLRNLKPGWTYLMLALIALALMPILLGVVKLGPIWRKKRAAKEKSVS